MIGFKEIDSPLGPLSIYSDGDCITKILFSSDEQEEKVTPVIDRLVDQLNDYFRGELKMFSVPLCPEGTEFQKRIWDLLQEIEYGRTISYMDLSKIHGDIKAIRAVGTANGQNPIPILIPCHRVIGSDGSLTGYAGGLDKKEWLLRHEGADIFAQRELF